MDSNYIAESEECEIQESQDFASLPPPIAPQFIQEQQNVIPSTTTSYTYQVYPANAAAYSQMNLNNANINNVAVNNLNDMAINKGNTLQYNNQNGGGPGITVDVTRNNSNYQQIMLPNGEFVSMNVLYNIAGNAYPPNGIKRKRIRTVFSEAQTKSLEAEYAFNRYLDQNRRRRIAQSLNLAEKTVKVWFQNHRMKDKKAFDESVSSSESVNAFMGQGSYQNVYRNYMPQHFNILDSAGVPQPMVPRPAYQAYNLPSYSEAVGYNPPINMNNHPQGNMGITANLSNFSNACSTSNSNEMNAVIGAIDNTSVSLYDSSPSNNSEDDLGLMNNQIFGVNNVNELSDLNGVI